MSRHAKHLRPINETRRADGTLTSETARRLLSRRGGIANAQRLRLDGFRQLEKARLVSALVRRAKALQKCSCGSSKGLSDYLTRALEALRHDEPIPLQENDARLLR